jgi:copper transport protein
VLAAPLSVALLSLALPAAAGAHATLLSAVPAPGARVETSPQRVTLGFTEPFNRKLTRAEIRPAGGGGAVAVTRSREGDSTLVLSPRHALSRGAYEVDWHAVSTTDGHEIEGSYGFGVGVDATGGARTIEQGPLSRGGWLRVLTRGALYALLLLAAGGLLSLALLGPAWPAPGPLAGLPAASRVRTRARAIAGDAALGAAALGAVVAFIDAVRAAQGISASALFDYLLVGSAGIARIAIVVFAGAAAALARRAPRAAGVAAMGALAGVTASGHAASANPRALALAADYLHVLGAAVWLGGAGLLVLSWWSAVRGDATLRVDVTRAALPAFGRVALPAFGVVALAGAVNALIELGGVSALWETGYGRVLAIKIALVAGIAGVAWRHAFRLRPRAVSADDHAGGAATSAVWRWLRAEPLLGTGVALLAGLLVAFPLPPHQLDRANAARSAVAAPNCDPCPQPLAAADELAVAAPAGSRFITAVLRREGKALAVTVRVLDIRARPLKSPVALDGAGGGAPCGVGCARFVLPQAPMTLRVRTSDGGRGVATAELPARWVRGSAANRTAQTLLARAERTMRRLRSVREEEVVSSGPGTRATTVYTLKAPDSMRFDTGGGVQTIQIDRRQWVRRVGEPWTVGPIPGGLPFRTQSWFRWSPYARSLSLLSRGAGRAELALYEPGAPVWLRLTIDERSGRVLAERLLAAARIIDRRYVGFNMPVRIDPPTTAIPQ